MIWSSYDALFCTYENMEKHRVCVYVCMYLYVIITHIENVMRAQKNTKNWMKNLKATVDILTQILWTNITNGEWLQKLELHNINVSINVRRKSSYNVQYIEKEWNLIFFFVVWTLHIFFYNHFLSIQEIFASTHNSYDFFLISL